jgi:Glycosyltransferase family 87
MANGVAPELSEETADERAEAGDRARRRVRAALVALWVAFAVTRLLPIALTLYPSLYGDISDPTGDLSRYAGWAEQIVGEGLAPYREVDIEYPPGSLPFVVVPALFGHAEFSRSVFVGMMFALDAFAFGTLLSMARRRAGAGGEAERQRADARGPAAAGAYGGVVAWLLLPPLLGVLLYGRLDLIPAVALLLGLERAHARRWATSGVWLGLGAAAKLFPALFVPFAAVAAGGRRLRLLAGVVAGGLVAWLPFAGDTDQLIEDVLGYHGARGIHLESLWGSLLNLSRVSGGPVELVFEFGAFHIEGPGAATMLWWTTVSSVAIVVLGVGVAVLRWWRHPQRAAVELPLAVTATLALVLGTGRVFSPQFMLWLVAAAAVLFTVRPRIALWGGPLLLVLVVMTALGYPLWFDHLRDGAREPALLLVYRNMAVIVFGVLLVARWLWPEAGGPTMARREVRPGGRRADDGTARRR